MADATAETGRRLVTSRRERRPAARVSLLVPSHALPPLSYRVPHHLRGGVRVGAAVVAPLSGYGRLGIVVGFEQEGGRDLLDLRSVVEDLDLPASVVKLCAWAAKASAQPLQAALRAALPPETSATTYEVVRPAPGWPWPAGAAVGLAELRRTLGAEDWKAAEEDGRIALAPTRRARRAVEWAVVEEDVSSDLRRAHRQRVLLQALLRRGGARPVAELLRETGSGREPLRRLVRRGAVRLEARPESAPITYARGSGAALAPYREGAKLAFKRGGTHLWRVPTAESFAAAAAVAREAAGLGKATLVLAPEVEVVERLVQEFEALLPAGLTVVPYHGGLGRGRDAVYEAARRGEVDVLVGTRAASLVPVGGLGAVCVIDEPNEAHRAAPGYEGVPLHARDLAAERGRIEGAAAVFLSPTPSLKLYAPEGGAYRLPPREPARWPAVSVVDMRGTGATLSSTMLDACRGAVRSGERAGIVVNRLGYATLVSCGHCGHVACCPACHRPLALHGSQGDSSSRKGFLVCGNCGRREKMVRECPACGSGRLGGVGLGVDRVRSELAEALGIEVGLFTADERDAEEKAPVVVGTPRCVLRRAWDLVAVPDADLLLFGYGSAARGFRLLYGAAEASLRRLLVQTRSPEHPVLRAALAGDYEAFAAAELPRRRAMGYPPYGHLAEVTLTGAGEEVRRAVESRVRPVLGAGVEMTGPAPIPAGPAGEPAWRLLLRGRRREPVAEVAALVAREAAQSRGRLKARIEVDPEEV